MILLGIGRLCTALRSFPFLTVIFQQKYARFHFSLLKWIEEDVSGVNNMGCAIVVLFGNAMKFYSLDAGYPGIGFLQSCSVIERIILSVIQSSTKNGHFME